VDALFDYFSSPKGTPLWFTVFDLAGGAINEVAKNATSYQHRDVLFYMQSHVAGMRGIRKVPVSQTTMKFMDDLNKIVTDALGGKDLGVYPGYMTICSKILSSHIGVRIFHTITANKTQVGPKEFV
jgi:hypothetical protein